MFKRILAAIMVCIMVFSFSGCDKKYTEKDLPQYIAQEFEICGLWAPHEISEDAFRQYKDAGFNVMSFTNHDEVPRSSENQYYIGSKRTIEALEICKKIDIDVYLTYGDVWFVRDIEGEDYFEGTPFTNYDYYKDYKDMIKGIHITDEPKKEKMLRLSSDTLIEDFKKVYPDTKYIINLIPATAVTSRDFVNYDEMLEVFGENILSKFETPYISVDVYPFSNSKNPENIILYNYNEIAKCAKKYNAETTMILQSSTGNEFLDALSEADMRFQAYTAIAFGADNLQYYCYSVPRTKQDDGSVEYLYNHCMLNQDGTPNELYYSVKAVNNEIQKFASAVLSYDWEQAVGISGTVDQTFRLGSIQYDENFDNIELENTKHYVSATATMDLVLSRFTSKDYGEGYMFVNFARAESDNNIINATFKDCGAIAIYGGKDYSGTPQIVPLDENGQVELELEYGEGLFVVPLV